MKAITFTPRNSYPNGKLREITRRQAAELVTAVMARLALFPLTADESRASHPYRLWTIPTAYGPLTVTVYSDHRLYFSIYCQFRDHEDERAKKEFNLGHSAKWNILEESAEAALNCLDYRLRQAKTVGDILVVT